MYVIFDMDGVISDSEAVYLAGHLHAARLYGLPEEDMRRAVGLAVGVTDEIERRIMMETFGHLPQYDYNKAFRACREYFSNVVESGQMELMPGAEEILRVLHQKGVPVGLASSSPRHMIEKVLERHDVLQYFDAIVSGDMVERSKPDPEIFLKCAARLGIREQDYDKTYVIEDSYNGIRAAWAGGFVPVMVPDMLPPDQEMREKSAFIFRDLQELKAFLAGGIKP